VVITYIYDPLYRLTEANYSSGEFYHYTYDQVGNRLTEDTHLDSHDYVYDVANRLASVDTVPYTFDDNGNLLSDGTNTYTYDAANRLTAFNGTTTYAYNGLGDRYQQTVSSTTTTYVLDLNAGLTQVLDDDDSAYLYGLGRIAEVDGSLEYFMGDALRSTRQLVSNDAVTLTKSYAPYGEDLYSAGSGDSAFAFTGEQTNQNGLVYLRARYYGLGDGRFLTRDTWGGNVNQPITFNRWQYANANPIRYSDPSGHLACEDVIEAWRDTFEKLGLCNPDEEPKLSSSKMEELEKLQEILNGPKCAIGQMQVGGVCIQIGIQIEDEKQCTGSALVETLSKQSQESEEPDICKDLEFTYINLVNAMELTLTFIAQTDEELKNETDPRRRQQLMDELIELENHLSDLIRRAQDILEKAAKAECDISSWPPIPAGV